MRHFRVAGQAHEYCAWPSITRTADGGLIVTYCRSEEHLGPSGAILAVRSHNDGQTWSAPIVVRDSIIDDREGGLTALADGRLLVHVWSLYQTRERYRALAPLSYHNDVINRWIQQTESLEYRHALAEKGGWVLVSGDHGLTWKLMGPGPDSVHGGIQLASGDLLVVTGRNGIHIERASPDSLEWKRLTAFRPPETATRRFGEPHLAQLPSGRIIMMLRSTAVPYDDASPENFLWTSWSDDEGQSWSQAEPTALWGFPPHLLTLSDGRILCSYGYRREPYGERACVSSDGIAWDPVRETVLRDDADSGDLGYPASVELAPGRILTVYYQSPHRSPPSEMHPPDPLRHKPDIAGTVWDLRG